MRLTIPQTIVVEGKYDKIRLESVLSAHIVTCDGFGVFKQTEKAALLRRLASERGLIVLTDPDGGGKVIRSHLRSILPTEGVVHLYIPAIKGKEKRKPHPSKEGLLGVEGMDAERIRALFLPFAKEAPEKEEPSDPPISKAELYSLGYSGAPGSTERRAALCISLSLPHDLSANAMLEAINLLSLQASARELMQSSARSYERSTK